MFFNIYFINNVKEYPNIFYLDRVSECRVCLQRPGCGRPAAHHPTEGDVRGRHHRELYVLLFYPLTAASAHSDH